jgi:hypothetical protein
MEFLEVSKEVVLFHGTFGSYLILILKTVENIFALWALSHFLKED